MRPLLLLVVFLVIVHVCKALNCSIGYYSDLNGVATASFAFGTTTSTSFAAGLTTKIDNSGNIYTVHMLQQAGSLRVANVAFPGDGLFVSKSTATGTILWVIRMSNVRSIGAAAYDRFGDTLVLPIVPSSASLTVNMTGTLVNYNVSTNGLAIVQLTTNGTVLRIASAEGGAVSCVSTFSVVVEEADVAVVSGVACSSLTLPMVSNNSLFLANAGDGDIFVGKMSLSLGKFYWANLYGGSRDDYGRDVAYDPVRQTIFVTGYFGSSLAFGPFFVTPFISPLLPATNGFLVQVNSTTGNVTWVHSFGNGYAFGSKVRVDAFGNAVMLGAFYTLVQFGPFIILGNQVTAEGFVAKVSSNGTPLWVISVVGPGQDNLATIALDNVNQNIYIVGASASAPPLINDTRGVISTCGSATNVAFFIKFSFAGETRSVQCFLNQGNEKADMDINTKFTNLAVVVVQYISNVLTVYQVLYVEMCVSCPMGTYGDKFSIHTASDCAKCLAGTYNPTLNATSISSCLNCPNGTFAANAGSPACTNCPGGFFSSGITGGKSLNESCSLCRNGTNSLLGTIPSCTACSRGSMNAIGCVHCDAGKYTEFLPSTLHTLLSGPGLDQISDIAVDSKGNMYITGSFQSRVTLWNGTQINAEGNLDSILIKVSPSFAILWYATVGGPSDDQGVYLQLDEKAGAIYLAGTFSQNATIFHSNGAMSSKLSSFGSADLFLISYAIESGTVQSSSSMGTSLYDSWQSFVVDTPTRFFLSIQHQEASGQQVMRFSFGLSVTVPEQSKYCLYRFASNGITALLCSTSGYARSLTIDGFQNLIVVFYASSAVTFPLITYTHSCALQNTVPCNGVVIGVYSLAMELKWSSQMSSTGAVLQAIPTVDTVGNLLLAVNCYGSSLQVIDSQKQYTLSNALGIAKSYLITFNTNGIVSRYSHVAIDFSTSKTTTDDYGNLLLAGICNGAATSPLIPTNGLLTYPTLAASQQVSFQTNQTAFCALMYNPSQGITLGTYGLASIDLSSGSAIVYNPILGKPVIGFGASRSLVFGSTSAVANTIPDAFLGTFSIGCTSCPVATYSPSVGSVNRLTCLPCPVSTYNNVTGVSQCAFCPAGTISTVIGAANVSVCSPCSAGTYSPYGSAICINCPAGYYSSDVGAPTNASCLACRAGTYSSTIGATSVAACIFCQGGTFSMQQAVTSQTLCQTCAAGFVSIAGSASCTPCMPGTFSQNGLKCDPCSMSTHSNISGSSNCISCGSGEVPSEDKTFCVLCKIGTMSNGNGTCVSCKEGTYASTPGSIKCEKCTPGSYAPRESANCLPCAKGFYSRINEAAQCDPCPINTYSNITGTTECQPCESGMACAIGSKLPVKSSYINLKSADAGDPFFIQQREQIRAYSSSEVARIIIIVVVLLVVLIALLLIIILSAVFSRSKFKEYKFAKVVAFFDRFSLSHAVDIGAHPINNPTCLGGVFTAVSILISIAIIIVISIDVGTGGNKNTNIAVVPKETINLNNITGNFFIRLILYNYGDTKCTIQPQQIGFVGQYQFQSQFYGANSTCVVDYTCTSCYLGGAQLTLQYQFQDTFAMASAMEYYMFVPHFDNENTPYIMMHERVILDNITSVFRGASPTQFSLSLTSTLYNRISAGDYFFYNIGTKFFNLALNSASSGYAVTKNPPIIGSIADSATFYQGTSTSPLSIQFTMAINPNSFLIQEYGRATILDFFSKIFALSAASTSGLVLFMVLLEKTLQFAFNLKNKKLGDSSNKEMDTVMQQ